MVGRFPRTLSPVGFAECITLGIIFIACDNDSTDALKRSQGPGKSVTDTSDDRSDRIGKRDMRASRRV